MYSKNLFISLLTRVILIIINSFAFISVIPILSNEYYMSLIGIGTLLIYQIYLLVNYINKTNRKLAHFFNSVYDNDSILAYPHNNRKKILDPLDVSLNRLNNIMDEMRRKNASQSLFLNDLVEHLAVGLITYTNDGSVKIFNHAAKELLHVSRLRKINDISTDYPELSSCISELQPYHQKLVKVSTKRSVLFLSLKLSIFKSEEGTINLLSIQNIRTELEQNELDSWQKLIRVLTHEISNSISPIASLANTTKKYFIRKGTESVLKKEELEESLLHKTIDSLNTIETTGKGLIDFVGKYKSLTALPQPKFEKFPVSMIFNKIQTLLKEEAKSNNIAIAFNISPQNIELNADIILLEKVLINLIKNAFQALEKTSKAKVVITALNNIENRIIINISDNGAGIPSNIIDNIFIPFYTTKEKGSGIGLSLSRQIMRLHNGTISVNSTPNKETIFSLVF